jgi:tRNA (guanine-N1)-methyltransferase
MLMACAPLVAAIEAVTNDGAQGIQRVPGVPVKGAPWRIYLSPRGKRLKQVAVERFAKKCDWLLLVCGHYEGIDQRVIDGWIDEELSIGDYVLTGGEFLPWCSSMPLHDMFPAFWENTSLPLKRVFPRH